MSAFRSWLFHSRRRTEKGSGEFARTSRPLWKVRIGQERRSESSTAGGGPETGLTNRLAWPLFADFEALAHRQNTLRRGLTPVHEKAALLSFVVRGSQMRSDTRRLPQRSASSD